MKFNAKQWLLLVITVLALAACGGSGNNSSDNEVDSTSPIITLKGENPLNMTVGTGYVEAGATATDNVDGDISASVVVGGETVDTSNVGTYVVTYNVSDAAGNAATPVTRTVIVMDTIPPEITLLGEATLSLVVGKSFSDAGAIAVDNVDGDISTHIIVGGDTVDTSKAGSYVITYDVSDSSANAAVQVSRTVNVIVPDVLPPEMTLLGANPLTLSVGTTYTDPGATATDGVDGDLSNNIVVGGDTVDTATVGTYVVTYEVSDAAGNAATQLTRTVKIVDTIAPVITLTGATSLNLLVGDSYIDPGASATDNVDGDISANIVVGGDTVDTSKAGSYVVTYDVSDSSANAAEQVMRTVNVRVPDAIPPVITLLGANPLTLSVGDMFSDPGATASDNVDGDLTDNIIVGGDRVDTMTAGTYVVSYDVSDTSKNAAIQVTRVVNVVNDPPLINSFSVAPDPVFVNSAATFSWQVSDVNGDALVCQLDVDNDGINDYTGIDCQNITSRLNIYTTTGNVTAKLTVDDGTAALVVQEINFNVIAPLSTDVSVNGPVVAGERLLYKFTVGNTTDSPINNVNVSLVLPAELSFYFIDDAEPNVSAGCSNCLPNDEAIWNLGTLAAGESRTISVNALVDAATLNNVAISLPVKFSATEVSDIQINKVVNVSNTQTADLVLGTTKSTVVPGETFSYQLDFGNTGGAPLTNAELTAFLPPGVSVVSISDGGAEVTTGKVVWSASSLGVSAYMHREIVVVADSGLAAGQILKATAQLIYDGGQVVDKVAERSVAVVSSAMPLQVEISALTNPVMAGDRAIYTLTVSNRSLSSVDNVSVLIRVPVGLAFYKTGNAQPDASCKNSRCDPAEEAVWSLGTLLAGESRTITIDALVDATLLSGNLISMPVHVSAMGLMSDIERLSTVAVFNMRATALALSASTDPVMPSETFTYQLDVGNVSAFALTTMQLQARLPKDVTIISISDGGIEDVSTGEVTWDVASLSVGESLHREVTVMANASLTAGEILPASARLTHDGGLSLDSIAQSALTVVTSAQPLSVDISPSAHPVMAGEHLRYTLTVSNPSQMQADNVSVLLRVPSGLSLEFLKDLDPDATSVTDCGTTTCLPTAEVIWSMGMLKAGESRTITVNALVDASLLSGNLISMPVRVTASGLRDVIDRQTTVAVFNTRPADMTLSASTDPVMPGEVFTYRLDVGNTSASALSTLQLRASLPAGVVVTDTGSGGVEVSNGEVVWNVPALEAGASLHKEVRVQADAGLSAGQILRANAYLTHEGGVEMDNSAAQVVTVASVKPLLNVELSAASPAAPGERVLYTLTVSNTSLLPTNDVDILLRIPAGLSLQRGRRDVDPDATTIRNGCGTSTCYSSAEVIWSLGTLAAGESRTITANPLVDAGLSNGKLIAMPIRVTATGLGDSINLLKTIAVYNAPSADLALSASADPVVANETFTYYLDVGNVSAGAITPLQLDARLPSGVSVVAISDSGVEVSNGEIIWSIGSLVAGASLHREVSVIADSVTTGDILSLQAELTHNGILEVDNSADFAVSVAANVSRLSVQIMAAPNPVVSPATLYGSLVYTITVTNDYALPVNGVELMFRLPAELGIDNRDTIPTITGCGTNLGCIDGAEAFFDLGDMAAGSSESITINASVLPGLASGTLINVPVRIIADGLPDTIMLGHVSAIQ